MVDLDMALIVPILAGVSFIAGFIDSIAGGGGLVLLPALLLAGIPPQTALGTNKFSSTFGTGVALINFIRKKKVVWHIAAAGVGFTLGGAFFGSKAILCIPNQLVGKIIVLLLPLALLSALLPRRERAANDLEGFSKKSLYLKVPLICGTIGFYDGFFGPGTGSFLIIAFYVWLGINLLQASATAKVFNLASNIGALTIFIMGGKVLFWLGLPLAFANILGNYFGSMLAIKKGVAFVKVFLIISLIILLISLSLKYFVH